MSRSPTFTRNRNRIIRNGALCECGRLAEEVDHVIPLMDGGTDDMANLQPLCHRHHVQKTRGEQRRAAASRAARRLRPTEAHPSTLRGGG